MPRRSPLATHRDVLSGLRSMPASGGHQAFPGGPCTPAILPVPAVRPTVVSAQLRRPRSRSVDSGRLLRAKSGRSCARWQRLKSTHCCHSCPAQSMGGGSSQCVTLCASAQIPVVHRRLSDRRTGLENRKLRRHKKALVGAVRSLRIWSKKGTGGTRLCRKQSELRGKSVQVKLSPC